MSLPVYTSMGSLIIDDIYYANGSAQKNILGGAGVFTVYGMRLWLTASEAEHIGFIVHKGNDFPPALDTQLQSLGIILHSIVHPGEHTTRGKNTFGADDHRDFEYICPILRTIPSDLPTDWFKSLRMVHLIARPDRALEIVESAWQEECESIWEPLPWSCRPDECAAVLLTASRVACVSPNHEETAALLGEECATELVSMAKQARRLDQALRKAYPRANTVLVVRAGRQGAFVVQDTCIMHITPFYANAVDAVVDVTGAGNGFCGGFAVGWVRSHRDPIMATKYGAVSASFALEQVGVPELHEDGTWNQGPSPEERLAALVTTQLDV